jgi:hypothetical protein
MEWWTNGHMLWIMTPYNTIGVPLTWNCEEYMPLYKVPHDHHFGWYSCNQVTHCCRHLLNMSHVIAMKAAVIRCYRWSISCVISKYTKVFIWPHKKKSKNYKSGALVTISMSFYFLSSDLGTVDSVIHAQQKSWITVWFCTNGAH